MAFHDVLFPTHIALGAVGGPERKTEIVALGSGFEERNAVWAHSRRRWNAGYGVRSLNDLHAVIAFFEARLGRLHGFRWRDRADWRSCPPQDTPRPTDQILGTGDGETVSFQLQKAYVSGAQSYRRIVKTPVAGSVRCALDGAETEDFTADPVTGAVTFAQPPGADVLVTAGFAFDCPARFDTDRLDINLAHFNAGEIADIPVVEIRL